MKKTFLLLSCLLSLTALALGQSKHKPLRTDSPVDLSRYAGTWFEIARLPNRFQRKNERAWAEYRLQRDGRLQVINSAIQRDGITRRIQGTATPVPGSGGARLRVRFGGLAALAPVPHEGNYWIIDLDQQRYRHALVGTPDRKFLWLLARTPDFPRPAAEKILARAREQGFATDRLIWTRVR